MQAIPLQPTLIKLLVAIGALLITPHIGELKPSFITIGFALLAWRLLTLRFPKALPNKWLLLPLAIGLVFFVSKTFGMSLGRDASSSLLIVLMGLKLLESKSARDAQAVIYMSFFMLITPFLFDQRIELAFYALGVFFMLLFALVINTTQTNTLKNIPLLRLSSIVLLQSIPLMLVFFLLFPRMIGPLWAMPNSSSAVSGISDSINPGQVSNLALSDKTAFRVLFNGPAPAQKDLYWRGPVFWETDGRSWSLTPPRKAAFEQASPIPKSPSDYQYTLMMEPHQQFWLYALDVPINAPNKARLTHDHQLILKKKLRRNIAFQMTSSTQAHLKQLSNDDRQRALKLPDNLDPRIDKLVKNWSQNATTNRDMINKALTFYNQEFFYTLKPPSLHKNPVAEFLFETKRGFCGHFATSFATLMRVANIPARLVGGYQGGVFNKVGGFYNIRQADAHVWVEVWLKKTGWTRIDPTAAISPDRIEHSIDASLQRVNGDVNFLITPPDGLRKWAQQLTWMIHSIDYYWQNSVLAYGPEKQLDFLSKFGIMDWGDMVLWLATLSGLILLISICAMLLFKKETLDPVQKSYLELCIKLAKKAGERQKHETTTDYFNRAIQHYPEKAETLKTLQLLYLKTRYGEGSEQHFIKKVANFSLR
ncbi:MAG: DUF3488 and DUF4129 domain-containing transglutaminase family protein [Cycloclasticus sp.]